MKRTSYIFAAAVATAALGLAVATANDSTAASSNTQLAFAGPGYGMGPGSGMGPGYGHGMRGQAYGHPGGAWGPGMSRRGGGWMMGGAANTWPGAVWADADKDGTLTVDEVKKFIETRHAARDFAGFKVGDVVEKDANISVQIVDANGNVVRTMQFPTKIDQSATARPGNGPGYGPGYGMRGGQGGRFMGHGYGYGQKGAYMGRGGRMGGGYRNPSFGMGMGYGLNADGEITVDEIKGILEARLAMWNNPNLKVGEIKEKDETTISAEIVTQEGSLVQRLEFDRKTGRPNTVR